MTRQPQPVGSAMPDPHRRWTMESGDAQMVLTNARRALFVMAGLLALLWAIQVANWADGYRLDHSWGITPDNLASLPYILTAPFLHWNWTHIEANSGPLFIFGFLAAYRGIGKWAGVTAIVIVTSGLSAWLFESPGSVGVGASGVVFGYLGYILVRGIFDRRGIDLLIGAIMALCFAYQFTVLLPHQGIGWQDHIGGLVGGIAAGWLLRERRAARPRAASDREGAAAVPAPPGQTALPRQVPQPGTTAQPGKVPQPGKAGAADPPGKGFAADPSNPRAELHKLLDDLGL